MKQFKPIVRSRHDSHDDFRRALQPQDVRSIIRLGSSTPSSIVYPKSTLLGRKIVEINTVEAVKNSASKLLMKQCFEAAEIKTAPWIAAGECEDLIGSVRILSEEYTSPVIAKHIFGSRGTGVYKLEGEAQVSNWMNGRNLSNYIIEKLIPMKLEFRFHVTEDGAFYVCRKALKKDIPKERRWIMNDSTCIWYIDSNEQFLKPNSFDDIATECVKALKALSLDVAAFDVRVQSPTTAKGAPRDYQDFFLVESNSGASHGSVTTQKYLETIPLLIQKKGNG